MEVVGTAGAEVTLATGQVDNIYRSLAPVIAIPVGAFLEYVAGPVHEKFSKRFNSKTDLQ